ncbi:hypothetical protein [Streptomyces sp. NPDC014806]|uniref:hypothetical protein n=1 Tax=Streptomyces sp. NPDC014806 TaxID=3364920 RepID=UPI0036F60CD8
MTDKTRRPLCGNDPRAQLTDGDRQAVAAFRAYLADRAALRDRIAETLAGFGDVDHYAMAAAVLAVVPPPVDRAAVLREAADAIQDVIDADRDRFPRRSNDRAALGAARQIVLGLIDKPRRMAAAAQPEGEAPKLPPMDPVHILGIAAGTPHACRNCQGVDPDTCFNNPHRPPEQCPAAEFEDYGQQCQKPVGHELHSFEEQPAAKAQP